MKFMHISDLHISDEMHRNSGTTQSVELLRDVQRIAEAESPNYVLLTGDITDSGKEQSFVNAKEWLFSTVSVGGEERIGLKLSPDKVFFVPGNHDA